MPSMCANIASAVNSEEIESVTPANSREPCHRRTTVDTQYAAAANAQYCDIVSGDIMPEHRLIRFVADPDGNIVPDAAAKLPGRGAWVTTLAENGL